ncbi:MAG: phage major capsid protein [Gemmatimonadales bacterium]|nr:phage major capsid protein [Gemmatimonadales bacterium]
MAYQDGHEIATVVTYLNRKFNDMVFEGTPLLAKLRERQKSFVGRKALEPIMTLANSTTQWMASGYDEVDLTPQAGLDKAEFPLVSMTTSVVMSDLERDQNRGPDEKIDLWTAKVEQAKMSAVDYLSTGLHSDGTAEANQITGLKALVSATGTYGGIARSGNTYWQSFVDSTAEALTDDDMLTAYNTASRGGRTYPDLILTTQALWEKYALTLTPNIRYDDTTKANLGFSSLQFMGAPVMWDPDVPTGYMYFLEGEIHPAIQVN